MAIDYNQFIHDKDREALNAFKELFPRLDKLFEKYMKEVDEKMMRVDLIGSSLRLGPDQLPKYYNMLTEIVRPWRSLSLSCIWCRIPYLRSPHQAKQPSHSL